MTFPARIRAASLIFGALLLTVLVSDVAGLPGCANGCKTATASAAALVSGTLRSFEPLP